MKIRILKSYSGIAVLLIAVLTLQSCVIIPSRAPVRQFEAPAISFLAPGMTAQSDVRRILGPPVVTTEDDRQWIYHERGMSREYIMFVGRSPSQMNATPVEYFLLLDFDRTGTLTHYHVEKNGTSCGGGICVARGKYYSIEAREQEAAQMSVDQCNVYVFADRPRIGAWIGGDSVEASIDGEQIGYLLDDDTYFHVQVDSGSHHLQSRYILNAYGLDALPKRIRSEETLELQDLDFECQAGEARYFEHVTDRKTGTRLTRYNDIDGAAAIAKRKLLRRLVYASIPAAKETSVRN